MSLYLCVDCGGSKTSAVITDANGTIVARASGGPSNFAYLALNDFISAIRDAVTKALEICLPSQPISLPLATTPFAAAWFGVSGVDSPAAVATITPAIAGLLNLPVGPRLVVANDTHLLAAPLRMHSDASHVVAVIGGTGAIAVSFREVEGNFEELGRIGGWGWMLGDEGGGFSIGKEAVRQILRANDVASVRGTPPPTSKLRTTILERFGVSDVMELLIAVHFSDPEPGIALQPGAPSYASQRREHRLSSLSPLVFSAAFEHSDPLALNVLRTMAAKLAEQIALLLVLDEDGSPRAVKASDSVVSFGGSLVGIKEYRQLVLEELERLGHAFKYVDYVDDAAAVGAVGLAKAYAHRRNVV